MAEAQPDPVEYFLNHPHFLQSDAWGEFQTRRGNEVIRRSGDGWEYLAVVERARFSKRLYAPFGPTYDDLAGLTAAVDDLRTTAKQLGLDFVRIEPRHGVTPEDLTRLGLRPSHHSVQPADTIVNLVDASQLSDEQVIAPANSTHRRRYRKALREGIEYEATQDPAAVEHFIEMIHDVSDRTGMNPHTDAYYRQMAEVLFPLGAGGIMLARIDGAPVSSILYFSDGHVLSYAHAANFSKYRNISPATGLYLYAMLYARETGHVVFDSYGVAPADAPEDHAWAGLTTFKVRGGGERVSTIGTWELPVKKLKYRLYHQLNTILDKS